MSATANGAIVAQTVLQRQRAAFASEVARCDRGLLAAKARQDEPAAFYWAMQRAAAVRLLPVGQP